MPSDIVSPEMRPPRSAAPMRASKDTSVSPARRPTPARSAVAVRMSITDMPSACAMGRMSDMRGREEFLSCDI